MPHAAASDGTKLFFEETGTGTPLIFVHEYAGDYRSWEPQLRHFGQRYHAIAFNARGYPPSDVPADPATYSQTHAADDILAVTGSSADRQGARGWAVDGRFCHTAFRFPPSQPSTLAHCRRMRLRRRASFTGSILRRGRGRGCLHRSARDAGFCQKIRWRADPRAICQQRRARICGIRSVSGVSTTRREPAILSLVSNASALRSTT